jgi:ketosteroid isomerase-like protein
VEDDDATVALADRLFSAMEAGDVDAVAATWADDVTVWHTLGGETRGKSAALAMIKYMVSNSSARRYELISRHPFDGGFVQQHVLEGTARNGKHFSARVALIVGIGSDGRITRMDEYVDPAALAPLLGHGEHR